jgi:hypothetical protein
MSDFSNFRAVFDEVTDDVMRARYQFFAEHLQNWLATLDETPQVKIIIERLQKGLDVNEFLNKSHATAGSMVGSAKLLWPEDRLQRLGMKLLVFREIAEKRIEAWNFGHDFMWAGSNLDDNVRALADQLFLPTTKELRRYLETEFAKEDAVVEIMREAAIPASDRIVRLDHNDPRYKSVVEALETLEHVIRDSNLYDDPEEKEMHLAEISAGRRLFESTKVRVAAIVTIVGGPLMYIAKHFIDSGLGKAAGATWDLVVTLIGGLL